MIYLVTNQTELFNSDLYKIISVEESLNILNKLSLIGLDTETTSLDCHEGTLLSIQFGNIDNQVVVDCLTIDIQNYKSLIESKDKTFIFWNAKFDIKWLIQNKIIPYNVYDGYLAEKMMWVGYPQGFHSMSLQHAAYEYLNINLDKSIRGKIIWNGLKSADTIVYGANDVKYLESIMNKQKDKLAEKGLSKAIQYENKFVIPLSYIEWCGVKLDVNKWKAKMAKDNKRLSNAEKALNDWLINTFTEENFPQITEIKKIRDKYIFINYQGNLFTGFNLEPQVLINWNSHVVVDILKLFNVDLTVVDKDKGGYKESMDAKVLKPQKDKCSLIPLLLDYKEAIKITSTYGENILKQINPKTGRLYSQYHQIGADTYRVTSGGKDRSAKVEYINLLNLPSDSETRACFVAEDTNAWISIDYSGQETYIMADVTGDTAILKELNEGSKDIHSLTAYMAYKEIPRDTPITDIKKKYHNLRQEAKGIEFAINYGGDANTICTNKGIPLSEATKVYNDYMNGFKGVKKYQDFCRKEVMEKGYILLNPLTGHKAFIYDFEDLKEIKSKFNNEFWDYYREQKKSNPSSLVVQEVRHYFKRKSTSEKQSINYRIQGTGAMCLRLSLIYFFDYLRKNNLLYKVLINIIPYDEINCEAPKEIAKEVATELYNCMIKAGAYFCTKCKLDADISYDNNGELPSYWIH